LFIIIYSLIQIGFTTTSQNLKFFFLYFFNHPKMKLKLNIICDPIQYTWFKFSPKSDLKADLKFRPLNCCITL
jgi:hypothetical protein